MTYSTYPTTASITGLNQPVTGSTVNYAQHIQMPTTNPPAPEEKFNIEVEGVARRMCDELFLLQEDYVLIQWGEDMTPAERRRVGLPVYTNHQFLAPHQNNGAVYSQTWNAGSTSSINTYIPPVGVVTVSLPQNSPAQSVPQWRKFRHDAALALAGWRAVNHYVLTT